MYNANIASLLNEFTALEDFDYPSFFSKDVTQKSENNNGFENIQNPVDKLGEKDFDKLGLIVASKEEYSLEKIKNISSLFFDNQINQFDVLGKINQLSNSSQSAPYFSDTKNDTYSAASDDSVVNSSEIISLEKTNNSLIDQRSGWIGRESNSHELISEVARCACPSCSSFIPSDFSPTTEPQSTTTSSTTPLSITSPTLAINSLLSGYKWTLSTNKTLTYSFYERDIFGGSYYGNEQNVGELGEATKTNVRNIFQAIESIIDIDFVEVQEINSSTYGTLRFMVSSTPSYAYAYYPTSHVLGGDVHLNLYYDNTSTNNGFQQLAGSHGYMSLIHEIGHTLGLKHTFEGPNVLEPALDNTANTVMTYNFTGSSAGTLMPLDIAALQSLYGAKQSNTNNNTYAFTRIDNYSLDNVLNLNTSNSMKATIWDAGGIDTLDFSNLASNLNGYRLDLNPGGSLSTRTAYSTGTSYTVNSVTYKTLSSGTLLAYNTAIENIINSGSNDEIFLNEYANVVSGYLSNRVTRNDIIWNGNSQDTLRLDYAVTAVTQTQNGNDLILGLGTNGSITLKNHFANSDRINITYANLPTVTPITVTLSNASLSEGQSGTSLMLFTASLSVASTTGTTFRVDTVNGTAIAGSDYLGITNGSLAFAAGETQKTIAVEILGDTWLEPNETFSVALSNLPSNVTVQPGGGIGTILDNDSISVTVSNPLLLEGNSGSSSMVFTVALSAANSQSMTFRMDTVNGTATAGSDYTAIANGSLVFAAGETQKTVAVEILGDTALEANETLSLQLSNLPSNVTVQPGGGMGTISNDDLAPANPVVLPTLAITDVTRNEGSLSGSRTLNFSFAVTLSSASSQAVAVQYATTNGTALAGSDYIAKSGTLNFAAGVTSQTFNVAVYADRTTESDELFYVNLLNPSNATLGKAQGIGTILNDDGLSITTPKNQNPASTDGFITPSVATDTLLGTQGVDRFILGDRAGALYGATGLEDFALIENFNSQNDRIQLYGAIADYSLAKGSMGERLQGMGIFYRNDLLALVAGVDTLNLASNTFSFVA
jgi:serralysin